MPDKFQLHAARIVSALIPRLDPGRLRYSFSDLQQIETDLSLYLEQTGPTLIYLVPPPFRPPTIWPPPALVVTAEAPI
jgi:hypothetical protein